MASDALKRPRGCSCAHVCRLPELVHEERPRCSFQSPKASVIEKMQRNPPIFRHYLEFTCEVDEKRKPTVYPVDNDYPSPPLQLENVPFGGISKTVEAGIIEESIHFFNPVALRIRYEEGAPRRIADGRLDSGGQNEGN
ncbi:hypothetical protein EG68_00212 [Paragonimus skrjabini miyazakii]|uniref:Uncharacterized protein n=1 Tax=Paragonimus skrjabini miyazakii TaxID=59628 RepID=A0A8S9ZAT5_9TREM|nr:hypothetical protein EG68_00212 [Paragonimus skrjabini miyazakii]